MTAHDRAASGGPLRSANGRRLLGCLAWRAAWPALVLLLVVSGPNAEAGAAHPSDGPEVRHVCAVAPDILSITLQAGTYVPDSMTPYAPQPGDEVVEEPGKEKQYAIRDGKVVEFADKYLYRTVDGKRSKVALVTPDGKCLFKGGAMAGKILDEKAVDTPAAYAIESAADPAYAKPVTPTEVFRKSKPDASNLYPFPFCHTISLKLPTPLKEGASYAIRFLGVNTSKETATYVHKPREVRSDAVHAIQTGYRPDDPQKCAYLSLWLGARAGGNAQDGGYEYKCDAFEVIDAAGKTVFTGQPKLTKALGAKEWLCVHEQKDYLLTAAYRLDFSSVNKPGEYRVFVPGIGTSYPFRIAADTWEKPFKTAMHGILTQRQGIELGPPFSDFKRGRPFHPDDGVEFYQLTITYHEGQEAGEGGQPGRGGNMIALAKAGKLERVTGVWGGYQDAGDWDTLGHHLSGTWDLLELYELNPGYFAQVKLALPPEEQNNALPDLLDEALWQMPCFRRLQLPDGGVRGGYGDGWGCRNGETSPMVKAAGVYAPDPDTTYVYAGCAAKSARILDAFDKKLAAEYLESAKRAWTWAEAKAKNLRNSRATAAVELYAATREPAFHEAFKKSTELAQEPAPRYLDQSGADFTYARLPDDLADPVLKKRAVALFTAYADYAIDFSHKNGFEIINGNRTDLPLANSCSYFSTPGVTRGYNLVRAYVLTQKPAYLAAAVQATNYCLGANPDNLSYCLGLGCKTVGHVLKVDAKATGQLPGQPIGYIPFGQGDEGGKMARGCNGWFEKWFLNAQPPRMYPHFYTWPTQECFVDGYTYAMMSECCFNVTIVSAAYTWGFLASRPAGADSR